MKTLRKKTIHRKVDSQDEGLRILDLGKPYFLCNAKFLQSLLLLNNFFQQIHHLLFVGRNLKTGLFNCKIFVKRKFIDWKVVNLKFIEF